MFVSCWSVTLKLMLMDVTDIIRSVSYAGLFGIIFAETGLLIGFFLPGDTLLLTAGVLSAVTEPGSSTPILSLPLTITTIVVAALLGDSTGYWIGRKFGPSVFESNKKLFKPEYIQKSHDFFDKYGKFTMTIAQFVPIVRTFAPTMAGASKMHYPTFLFYNVIGVILWSVGLPVLGYYLGGLIPPALLDKYVMAFVGMVVLVTVASIVFSYYSHRNSSKPKVSDSPES